MQLFQPIDELILLSYFVLFFDQWVEIFEHLEDAVIVEFGFNIDLHFLLACVCGNLVLNYGEHTIVISLNAYFTKWFLFTGIRQLNDYVRSHKAAPVQELNAVLGLINDAWDIR